MFMDYVFEEANWKSYDSRMSEVIDAMKKIIKLHPKTQTYHFIDIAKKIFSGSNLKNKETILLLL